MKTLFLPVLFAITGLYTSCTTLPNDSNKAGDLKTNITGTWELRQTSAAMIRTPNNYTPGNGSLLKFAEDTYQSYDKGVVIKSGKYSVVEDSTYEESVCLVPAEGEFRHRLIFDGDTTATKQFIQVTDNKLTIMSGCYALDAGTSKQYEKVGDKAD